MMFGVLVFLWGYCGRLFASRFNLGTLRIQTILIQEDLIKFVVENCRSHVLRALVDFVFPWC
jgi:hypothetical protein